jgi:hypothetical protein
VARVKRCELCHRLAANGFPKHRAIVLSRWEPDRTLNRAKHKYMLGLTDRGQPPPSIANTCTYTHTLDSIGSSKMIHETSLCWSLSGMCGELS